MASVKRSTKHSFDVEVAGIVGVNAAVLYENICYWIEKNEANDRHCYDGKYWTYNSAKAFDALFPYLTVNQIRTALEKLVEAGLIEEGNFNKSTYDRTKWFCAPTEIHLGKNPNGSREKPEPIPDSKPDDKPDTPLRGLDLVSEKVPVDHFEHWWQKVWPKHFRKSGKTKCAKKYRAIVRGDITPERFADATRAFLGKVRDQQYLCAPLVFMNDEKYLPFLEDEQPDPDRQRFQEITRRNRA